MCRLSWLHSQSPNHSASARGTHNATTFKYAVFGPANRWAPQPGVKRLPDLKARGFPLLMAGSMRYINKQRGSVCAGSQHRWLWWLQYGAHHPGRLLGSALPGGWAHEQGFQLEELSDLLSDGSLTLPCPDNFLRSARRAGANGRPASKCGAPPLDEAP
ncbi:unnamed protein product [Pleuronectes platessa]|uniref:Uncharacterized protein n=1 Tax=Pleuronectes platessa TaxID=8262 RepID=A0A9N7TZA2_PLEPL|nr:unnamed protein product [Pleuronectes platessa]